MPVVVHRWLALPILAVAASLPACDEYCLLAACEDALLLTVELPGEPARYLFTFVTDAGQTSCVLAVPLEHGASDCDDSMVARWAPKDDATSTVATIAILNSATADLSVTRDGEEVHSGEVSVPPAPGPGWSESEGTAEYCGAPCYSATATLDLDTQEPPGSQPRGDLDPR